MENILALSKNNLTNHDKEFIYLFIYFLESVMDKWSLKQTRVIDLKIKKKNEKKRRKNKKIGISHLGNI